MLSSDECAMLCFSQRRYTLLFVIYDIILFLDVAVKNVINKPQCDLLIVDWFIVCLVIISMQGRR